MTYLSEVHRLNVNETSPKWEKVNSMFEARSGMACQVVQYKWTVGIMVAGGYKQEGAWTPSVEFLNFKTGRKGYTYYKQNLDPSLQHTYNILANILFSNKGLLINAVIFFPICPPYLVISL